MKGKKVDLEPAEEPRQAEVVDLMERLRRSLEQGGGKGTRKTAARAKTRAGTAKKRHEEARERAA